jgi:hypothetical protein
MRNAAAIEWLYRQDSYTNAIYGHAASLSAAEGRCVSCRGRSSTLDARALCLRCIAKRRPDPSAIVLFRPMRLGAPSPSQPSSPKIDPPHKQ